LGVKLTNYNNIIVHKSTFKYIFWILFFFGFIEFLNKI
jgi:hypothetical protein